MKSSIKTSSNAYFDPTWKTEVTVDASPVGLAAALIQENPDNPKERRIVEFKSRSLTSTEKNYSQFDREFLAVPWACEKFNDFLLGMEFQLNTDNKPLSLLLNNPRSKLSARHERLSLRLTPYKFIAKHIDGLTNIADYPSRHPEGSCARIANTEEEYVNFIVDFSLPKALTLKEISEATQQDEELTRLMDSVRAGYLDSHPSLKPFKQIFHELSISTKHAILLRGRQVVIPAKFQERIIDLAHEGHLGICKTKALLRSKVWFKGIDAKVERAIASCPTCQANTRQPHHEPLQMSPMPTTPWEELSIDFFGPLPNNQYLLVIEDDYTRFPIIRNVKTNNSEIVIPKLAQILDTFGIPRVIKSDNGSPFQSQLFREFSEHYGFIHRLITPLHPMSNAIAERFMQVLKKTLKNAYASNKDLNQEIERLLRTYRSTPHSTTNKSPSELLFGYSRTSRLPELFEEANSSPAHQQARKEDQKAKAKMKKHGDKRLHARKSNLQIGDKVLLNRQLEEPTRIFSKTTSIFDPKPFEIIDKKHSMITAARNGDTITRNSSFFKRLPPQISSSHTQQNDRKASSTNSAPVNQEESNNLNAPATTTRPRRSKAHYA